MGNLEAAARQVVAEQDITMAAWYAHPNVEFTDEDPGEPAQSAQKPTKMASRAYQLEMLEASLKENIICAMDTGSGKTWVAILRIMAELAAMPDDLIIWFLAPTVSLCSQQYDFVRSQIPSVQTRIITGSHNVDSWSASTWNSVLVNIKIVISTHQVLLDALLHAHVRISSLALLIFDEAHHCVNQHPYSRIMKEFYDEARAKGDPVPHILGLTASPVVHSDIWSLQMLETTLNAVCRSPTKHRDELLDHVQRPVLAQVVFKPKQHLNDAEFTDSVTKLIVAWNRLDILEDPYVGFLTTEKTDRARRMLEVALRQKKTYVQDSMKTFCRRSVDIAKDLGTWAADWYISQTINRYLAGIRRQGAISHSYKDAEVVYLARIFEDARIHPPPHLFEASQLSDKVKQLIQLLLAYEDDTRGIIFVKERTTTMLIGRILTIHPEIRKKFRVGTMVGTSSVPGIKHGFLDLPEQTHWQSSLEDFRNGKKNLLVATSVLEEGIDVPACNLVICVDKPANLKSFIQRRGRARQRQSRLCLFVGEQDLGTLTGWEELEADMKRHYEDQQRQLRRVDALKDSRTMEYPELRSKDGKARLTIHDVKSRLQHFCSTLSSRKHVQGEPDYIIQEFHDTSQPKAHVLLKATVILPISVPQCVRQATGTRPWRSEKLACMDAAFQAYQALYHEGLIADNLLPLRSSLERSVEGRNGLMPVGALYNPWLDIARAWTENSVSPLHRRKLRILSQNGSVVSEFELILPGPMPKLEPLTMWWDYDTQLTLYLEQDTVMQDGDDEIGNITDHTPALLALAYGHRRMEIKDDCVVRFILPSCSLSRDQIGNVPFTPDLVVNGSLLCLVRDGREYQSHHPYYFDAFLSSKPPMELIQKVYKGFETVPDDMAHVAVRKWPRKTGFFHRPEPPQQSPSTKPYSCVIPANTTTVDSIHIVHAELGSLIPSVIHYLELYLLAAHLARSLLAPLNLSNTSLIVQAICASSARTPENYERIEFLGDSILKTCITVTVAATNLRVSEGVLSLLKDRQVSNSRLCRAAHESGLHQYIVSQQLVLNGWRPPYVSDLLNEHSKPDTGRVLATKTLADVVEALIGVSYVDGGLPKALECIRLFVPESRCKDLAVLRNTLYEAAKPKGMSLPVDLQHLEHLIGYTFKEKSLLVEAVTHPSYALTKTVACFDRLEFLGDAILDYIVVQELFKIDDPPLENWEMHLFRTALVNADILAFFVMEWSHTEPRVELRHNNFSNNDSRASRGSPETVLIENTIPLWSFMRQASPELTSERKLTQARHVELRKPILDAIYQGTHYPWALLTRLHAQKFYSDFFEALIGAIWVDSGPDFGACKAYVEDSGILPYLRRLRKDRVHLWHPKEELGKLADQDKVEYIVVEVGREAGQERTWACGVRVGDRLVAFAEDCLHKEEAKVTAAAQACELLKTEDTSNKP